MRARISLTKTLRTTALALPLLVAFGFAACGGEPTPPPAKPEPTLKPTASEKPSSTPEPTPEPTTTASASASAATPPPPPVAQERPPVLMSSESELSGLFATSPGAKLELGDDAGRAVFRIREGTLPSPFVITFKVDPKGKSTGVPIGKIYRMIVQVENSQSLPTVETQDKPFELTFPAGAKKEANLAIGAIITDDSGREKITWTIVAPEKIDDATNTAFFKIKQIGNSWLHVTAKPATAPAAPK